MANGYNSGDEYTGRTENNLTLAEWQEVGVVKRNITNMMLILFSFLLMCYIAFCNFYRETDGLRSACEKRDLLSKKWGKMVLVYLEL